jgi:hypothetical protein
MTLPSLASNLAILAMALCFCGTAGGQGSHAAAAPADSVHTAMLLSHLRGNFDDIHDVSMRFHHLDHRLNGMIRLHLCWVDGRLTSSEVVSNETGNRAFAEALTTALQAWHIPDLTGPFETDLPLRIRIVGRDDSTFAEKAILTGVVRDRSGTPIRNARIRFTSAGCATDSLRPCTSNREGVFVKTLIPPGSWKVECWAAGFAPARLGRIAFARGEHARRRITLRPAR